MRSRLTWVPAAVFALAGMISAPAALIAQSYICTTTTTTTTYYHTDADGVVYITTVTVSSRVCVPYDPT